MTKVSRANKHRSSADEHRQDILCCLRSKEAPAELVSEIVDCFEDFYRGRSFIITRLFIKEDREKLLELAMFCDVLQPAVIVESEDIR